MFIKSGVMTPKLGNLYFMTLEIIFHHYFDYLGLFIYTYISLKTQNDQKILYYINFLSILRF